MEESVPITARESGAGKLLIRRVQSHSRNTGPERNCKEKRHFYLGVSFACLAFE